MMRNPSVHSIGRAQDHALRIGDLSLCLASFSPLSSNVDPKNEICIALVAFFVRWTLRETIFPTTRSTSQYLRNTYA